MQKNLPRAQLSQSQISYLIENLPSSLIAVSMGLVVMFFMFKDVVSAPILWGWVSTGIVVVAFRTAVFFWVKQRLHESSQLAWAERLVFLSALATGILWGVGSILFAMSTDMFYWVFLAFFMSGYASGAVFSTAAFLPACAAYFFPTLLPITAWFFFQEDSRAPLMGALLLGFVFVSWNMARNANAFLLEKIEAQVKYQLAEQEIQTKEGKVQALQTMAGGVAHGLNNILAAMVGHLYLAKRDPALTPKLKKDLDILQICVGKARDIGEQMLEYSDSSLFKSGEVDMRDVMTRQLEYWQAQEGKLLEISMPETVPKVKGNLEQVDKVFKQLISNAFESYDDEQGMVALKLEICELDAVTWLVLHVHDDGGGMTQEVQEKIFDPFFSTKFAGRGLGMSVVYGIVQRMGGSVEFVSVLQKGTTVSVYFPTIKISI